MQITSFSGNLTMILLSIFLLSHSDCKANFSVQVENEIKNLSQITEIYHQINSFQI